MSELFSKDDVVVIDPNKDYSTEILGEGKKYKDLPALARGAVEKDVHISRIERENRELREDLQKRVTLEEVMTKLTQTKQVEQNPVTNPSDVTPAQGLTKQELEAEIARLVASKVNETEAERQARANFDKVKAELQSNWGADWQNKLEAKRQELGLGQDWLNQVAGQHPAAFLSLVGVGAPAEKSAVSPFEISPSGVNLSAMSGLGHRGEKTQKYYKDMRSKDPVKYNSKAVQKEIYDQAMKLGASFFDA